MYAEGFKISISGCGFPGTPDLGRPGLLGIATCTSNGHLRLKMAKVKLFILVPTLKLVILFLFPLVLPTPVNGTTVYSSDQTRNLSTP